MRNPSHAAASCLIRDIARQTRASAKLAARLETYLGAQEYRRFLAIHGCDVIHEETAAAFEEFARNLDAKNWRAAGDFEQALKLEIAK